MDFSQVRLSAFDMDGTLLNRHSQMTEVTKQACRLLQASGRKLVLATGRTYGSALIPVDHFPFDGYVCSNGAAILEKDGTLVKSTLLPNEMVIDAIHKIRKEPIYYELHDTASNRWMVKEDRDRIDAILEQDTSREGLSLRNFSFYKLAHVVPLDEFLNKITAGELNIVKVFVWNREEKALQRVQVELGNWGDVADITSSGENNIEIMPKGVSKWAGLQYFCEKWNLSPDQIMAFGDADNDLEILSHVGYSVAMENATPNVKAVAKFMAKHHDHDGVAAFITERVLGE